MINGLDEEEGLRISSSERNCVFMINDSWNSCAERIKNLEEMETKNILI